KVVDDRGVIADTPDRATLFAAQTPQVFEKKLYLEALRSAKGKSFTDDCSMVEQMGADVHIVMGSYDNIKLTTVQDIPLAESILKQRGEKML
ncbi:MAG: 2-C-methyl-D-erythritol 4-phosphate cytidylyltransferase, partial [Ruminococcus sp.]